MYNFPYMDGLSRLINHYEHFKDIAVSLEWGEVVSEHHDFSVRYPIGFHAHICTFSEGYLAAHFEEAFVQTMLLVTAWYEEWAWDFWDMSYEERMHCLTNGAELYQECIHFPAMRLPEVTTKEILAEILSFQQINAKFPEESIRLIESFGDTPAVDLGSTSVNPDYTWICTKGDTILLVCFGVWD